MFPRKRAAHLHAELHDLFAGGPGAAELSGIAVIEKNQGMQVSVSGVKDISDHQAAVLGDFFNAQKRRREFSAWDDPIQHVIRGRDAADGTEGLFAAFPKQGAFPGVARRSEEHTSELQSHSDLVCRLLLEKKKKQTRAP